MTLFAGQLTAFLAYADQVQLVDTSGIDAPDLPSSAVAKLGGIAGREDAPAPSLDRDVVLSQAPAADRAAGIFKVPRVLGS